MMHHDETTFLGLHCARLRTPALTLLVSHSAGPRVLALHAADGPNLFAELPDFTLPCPGKGTLRLWGGHRLWHAPEVARRTYLPDDAPVAITPTADGLVATQETEAETGLQKVLRISLAADEAAVTITHELHNRGLWPVTCAPWAITQLRPGGTAVLPQPTHPIDPDGLQPNRPLALWPYTDVNSPHITWGNQLIRVHAPLASGALKLGFPNRRGWLAYHWQDTLFVKWAAYDPAARYLDFDSSSQCYCNDQFLELETLGPEAAIPPGGTAVHREVWRVWTGVALPEGETAVSELVAHLKLDQFSP